MADPPDDEARFVRRMLIGIAFAAGALLLWRLRSVLVLMFGAVLIATIVRAIADPLHRRLHFPERLAVLTSVLLIVATIAATTWLVGAEVAAQSRNLEVTLVQAGMLVDQRLGTFGLGHPVEQWLMRVHSGDGVTGIDIAGFVSSTTVVIASFLVVFFGGIFLAAQPRLYGIGLIKLVPPARRGLVAEAMMESERALRLWLKAQVIAMILIGLMTGTGLWLLGVRSPLALALISGILEFIPYAGAITSSVPAILVALTQGPELALWTVGLYVLVHHVEAYVIQPLIQQGAVEIPAVLTLFALLAFGLLFGILGILLAAPLAVVGYVLVKRLYVIEALGTQTPVPGEDRD